MFFQCDSAKGQLHARVARSARGAEAVSQLPTVNRACIDYIDLLYTRCDILSSLHYRLECMCILTTFIHRNLTIAHPPADAVAGQISTKIYALVQYEDAYVQPLILKALQNQLPSSSYSLASSIPSLPDPSSLVLQIVPYESLDFDHLLAHPTTSLANAYIIRKALIRKHYLSHTVSSRVTKNPESILKHHVKPAVDFELDYAEFLDEALLEAYELHESFARNENKHSVEREWWILKPSMSDRGQGIRLFSTEDELRAVFEEWEAEQSDSETDSTYEHEPSVAAIITPSSDSTAPILDIILGNHADSNKNSIITSQLRHFIAQPYIDPPLLLPSYQNRKFHIRTYVLAVGALRVYVYKDMLALFAPLLYSAPGSSSNTFDGDEAAPDLRAHLTNTCLQDGSREGSVQRFWDLPSTLSSFSADGNWKAQVFDQICAVTGELFEAAARGQMVHFQMLPNAFEVFGVDWLIDAESKVWLLEVNAFPDFGQTGKELRGVVEGLWEGVVGVGIRGFFGVGGEDAGQPEGEKKWGMKKVLDVDLGRR